MGAEGASLKCPCGHAYPRPSDATVPAVCPACRRPATTITPAETHDPTVGLDKILIEKGWVTPDQIKAALARQEEEAKQGRQMRLGEALVALGWAKPEQIREALTVQGRTPMHCPTCKKTFNIKVPKPGMRVMCKTCRVPLAVPGSITDLHADETGTGAQPSFVGESAEPALTDLIPGYTIERKISTGGMGEVFLGKQKALDRAVAIKLLTQDLARDATYVQRFMAEARSAAKLRHENIVAAVDAGETKGRYYFVMEYVQGETVQQIVKRDGALSEHRALEMARQIARGLKHAHQQGLIHRDIKSANIMIGLDGIAKICDFGLAREIKVDVSVTQPGMVHASPAYASPEQCRAVKLDHRSDMYSLGVTVFEMMTAHLPFKADAPSALFVAHATQAPPTVKSLNPAVSQAASQLVARLLRKTPDGRFKDYDELLAAIDQVEKSPVSTAPVKTLATSGPGGLGPGAKWAVVGVAATFLIVLAVALLKRGRAAENPLSAPVAAEEKGPDKLLRDARAFESARWGKPSEYPAVRARWKGLVDQFRGTPQHNQFAGPLLDFEARVEQEADAFAKDLEEKAKIRIDAGKISVALGQLRTLPSGYEGTPAAARISGLGAQLEKNLDGRLAEGKEQCWSLISAEKFEEARKAIDDLRVALGYVDEQGPQFAKPSHREELESLDRKLEEERLFARKRAAEAAAKNSPTPVPKPAPPEPPKPTPKPDPGPLVLPADPVPGRRPAPAGAELKQSEDLVRDLFKEQYARKTPAAKVELARKMFDLAKQTKDDPAGKFVLYRESRDLAASGGDSDLANRAIDELAREYEINASSMKTVVLSELTLNARTPEECKAAANAFLRLADESIEAKDYAGGERAAGSAVQLARRAKDIPLVARATAKAKECADLKANPDKPVAPKASPAGELDLLGRIEPAADSLQGAWKVSDGKLVSPLFLEPKFASCAVPYVPPEEYDLTLVAERRTGRSSLAVGLVAGGKQFDLELDGFEGPSGRAFSGLDRVDGVWPPKGETAFRGGIFADHASHTVVVRVRKTSIVIALDGQQVLSWTADYRRVSAPHPLITVKSADSLFLAAWQSEYVIQRLTLKPVSGQGRFTR